MLSNARISVFLKIREHLTVSYHARVGCGAARWVCIILCLFFFVEGQCEQYIPLS